MRLKTPLLVILGMILGCLLTIGITAIYANRDFKNTEKWLCIDACHRSIKKIEEKIPEIKERLQDKLQKKVEERFKKNQSFLRKPIGKEGENQDGGSSGSSEASKLDIYFGDRNK